MTACPWATPAIDARIVALREAKISLNGMAPILFAEFDIVVNKDKLLRRTRTLGLPVMAEVIDRREMTALPPVAPGAWTSPECDALFRVDWDAGISHRGLAARFGVSKDIVARRARLLGFTPRPGGPKHPKAEPPLRPRSASGRHGSSIMFRGLATLPTGAVEHVAGRCSWPLSCSEPAETRFCAYHMALRKAA